ncbi:hypothetical protein Agub_g3459 [Astrephomene gubernaculifera]|uniref:AMP-dependent synthetase/ligase domain-containing protein n=1 Tax=Astrephomene gubernaculifera TaxID=47775 RepID=A0AAD3DLB5_9CHLO|nr:hypothetical protein Agub_g3459 [Astrephomene gubernaculifera]
MQLSTYHQSVLNALLESGACSAQQVAEVEVLLRGLTGECAADGPEIWRHITSRILLPSHDFAVHQRLAAAVYDNWPVAALGRPPLWLPHPAEASETNVARFLESIRHEPWWRGACARHGVTDPLCPGPPNPNPSTTPTLSPAPTPMSGWLCGWRVLQAASWEDPEAFWPAALRTLGVAFSRPPARALQLHPADPDRCTWLPGCRLNIAAAALTCPRAPPGCPALLWAPDGRPGQLVAVGRGELAGRAAHIAACIRRRFEPGSPLALYLPLSPASAALYLGCVLAGCCVVSVADSFSAGELRTRLALAGAVGVFTQDVVLRGGRAHPLYEKVVEGCGGSAGGSGGAAAPSVVAIVMPAAEEEGLSPSAPPLRPGDMSWADFLALTDPRDTAASDSLQHPFLPEDPSATVTNILFSSGTTGEPKAIPWSHLTPLRCALDAWAQLDVRPGTVVGWPSSLGWMMGPWLLYAALLNGGTAAIYGGAPLGPDFLRFVSSARVQVLGLVPSIVRAWRHGRAFERAAAEAAGGAGGGAVLDLSCVRLFGSTGEASAAEDYAWLMSRIRGYRPVIEYCGGTEIGGGFLSGTLLHPCAPSTFSTPTLGARLLLLAGEAEAEAGSTAILWDGAPATPSAAAAAARSGMLSGEVALAAPMLGMSQRLLNRDHYKVYYAGMPLYRTLPGAGLSPSSSSPPPSSSCSPTCPPPALPLRRHGDEVAVLRALGPGPRAWSYCALGRCDDTMNLGGIKVSSVELERAVVAGVPVVAEAAAVGVAPPQGGPEQLHLFLVLKQGAQQQGAGGSSSSGSGPSAAPGASEAEVAELQRRCQQAVRDQLNPLFKVSRVAVVASLPRNASNKVMRRLLREGLPGRARM